MNVKKVRDTLVKAQRGECTMNLDLFDNKTQHLEVCDCSLSGCSLNVLDMVSHEAFRPNFEIFSSSNGFQLTHFC